jgi:hypothetical protein
VPAHRPERGGGVLEVPEAARQGDATRGDAQLPEQPAYPRTQAGGVRRGEGDAADVGADLDGEGGRAADARRAAARRGADAVRVQLEVQLAASCTSRRAGGHLAPERQLAALRHVVQQMGPRLDERRLAEGHPVGVHRRRRAEQHVQDADVQQCWLDRRQLRRERKARATQARQ